MFPPTKVTWRPLFSANDWCTLNIDAVQNTQAPKFDLKPADMTSYSQVRDQLAQEKRKVAQSERIRNHITSGTVDALQGDENCNLLSNFNALLRIDKEREANVRQMLIQILNLMICF